jgi:LytS/YehU family sensor histidine kinase
MLFDSLGRIGALHALQPEAADALLADLIALLRAMLPGAKVDNSTVEREFALVEAWLRVTRNAAHGADRVDLRMTPDARPIGIAPMLVLPLLRAVLALPCPTQPEWVLSAKTASDRLIVTLQSKVATGAEADSLLERADLSSLNDRLAQLFGRSAQLTASSRPPTLTLDLPRLQGDPDDDRADR